MKILMIAVLVALAVAGGTVAISTITSAAIRVAVAVLA
jgi:hypothetical protein